MKPVTAAAAATVTLVCSSAPAPAGTFSTAVGGPGLDAWGAGVVAGPGTEACMVVMARDWYDFTFGEPWIIVLDDAGGICWRMVLGRDIDVSRDLEAGGVLRQLADGSVLVGAQGEPRATGIDADACIMRVTPRSGMEWARVIGANDDGVYSIVDIAAFGDGSFAAAYNEGCGSFMPYVNIYGPDGDLRHEVALSDSGGFVFAAGTTSEGLLLVARSAGYWPEVYLDWIDVESGETVSSAVVSDGYEQVDGMLVDSFGRIWLCGTAGNNPWICCATPDGKPMWQRTLTAQGGLSGLVEAPDGGAVSCGYASGSGLIVHYAPDGSSLWSRSYDGGDYSSLDEISTIPGGGYLLSGTASAAGSGDTCGRAWILAVDGDGLVDGCPRDPASGLYDPVFTFQQLYRPHDGWTVACGVYGTYEQADNAAARLAEASDLPPEVLWIPDWPSLSGYEGWLACLVPEGLDEPGWEQKAAAVLEGCPDAYLVWLGMTSESRRRELVADD